MFQKLRWCPRPTGSHFSVPGREDGSLEGDGLTRVQRSVEVMSRTLRTLAQLRGRV